MLDLLEKNSTPLVSIAMATYNGEAFLREQLDSIYAQTYKNIEVIVTDDCSSDKTIEILKYYSETCGLKYNVNKSNLGFAKNFEKAVSLCKGDYIALSDQDDIWFPEKIAILVEKIENYSIACSDASLIDCNGANLSSSLLKYAGNTFKTNDLFSRLLISNFVTGCTILGKNTLFKNAHPIPAGIRYHDWWYALMAAKHNSIYFHNSPLLYYRQHGFNQHGATQKNYTQWNIYQTMHTFQTKYISGRKDYYLQQSNRLKIYRDTKYFSASELKTIDDFIYYYESRINNNNRFERFKIALKYRKSIFYNDNWLSQWLKCIRTIF